MRVARYAVCVVMALLGVGCDAVEAPDFSTERLVRAEVTRYVDPDGHPIPPQTLVMEDPAGVRELLAFFPQSGRRNGVRTVHPEDARVMVAFTNDTGRMLFITVTEEKWSEAHGDWSLDPRFAGYIAELFAARGPSTRPARRP